MKESEYIIATNRVKVSAALTIVRDVLPGEDYGISQKDLSEIYIRLSDAEERLFKSYSCDEG